MTRVRHLLACAAIGLGLLGSTPHCVAQGTDADYDASLALRDGAMRLINEVLDRLWEVMSPEERAILQETDVRMPMDYDITRVVAYREPGRVIDVSFGFYGTMARLCRDWVLANYYTDHDPSILNVYDAYLSYVDDTIDRNDRSIGQDRVALLPFTEFAGIPVETAEAILSGSDADYQNGALQYSAIGFVLAHEFGHHVLGHVDSAPVSPADSRIREAEADRYAFDLTTRAGMTAFGALPALVIFVAAEEEFADPTATHPNPACRIYDAWIYAIGNLANDASTAHLFDGDPAMLPGGARYQSLISLRNNQCS